MNCIFRMASVMLLVPLGSIPSCQDRAGDDGGGAALTTQQKAAVDAVVMQLDSMASAVGGAVDGLTSVDRSADGQFGVCPEVTYAIADGVGMAELSFPEGCQNEYYQGSTISGDVTVEFDLNTEMFTVTFADFAVDGQTTNGAMSLQRGTGQDFRTWDGVIDITTSGAGSAQGEVTLKIDTVRKSITIEPASLTFVDADGVSYNLEIRGLLIKPVANQNFVPEAGTVTFELPNTVPVGPATVTVVVTFDTNSPVDGTVSVKVGNRPPVESTLPGF